jgi:plastocyanin
MDGRGFSFSSEPVEPVRPPGTKTSVYGDDRDGGNAMREVPRVLAGVVVLAAALAGCGGSGEPAAGTSSTAPSGGGAGASGGNAGTVTTHLLSFGPTTVTVRAGTTVTWHDGDAIGHTVTTGAYQIGGDGLRTSEKPDGRLDMPLAQGTDVRFTFAKPGTYTYFCSIHKGMNGTVVVTP